FHRARWLVLLRGAGDDRGHFGFGRQYFVCGFPRLSSLLARDRFLPRQLANLGDRLVFSNGIVLLAVFSGSLVWWFRGDTSRLLPLYAVGVFLSFTLSQAGMVVHWWREGNMLRGMREAAALSTPVATATQSRSEIELAG